MLLTYINTKGIDNMEFQLLERLLKAIEHIIKKHHEEDRRMDEKGLLMNIMLVYLKRAFKKHQFLI